MVAERVPEAITGASSIRVDPGSGPADSARAAGLRYVSDLQPGIRRSRAGDAFTYTGLDGRPVRAGAVLARIKALAIPPAWTDVWICPLADGHIQATGRDARGRKQYRYHPRFRAVRDQTKYGRMAAFGRALPRIRARVEADLMRPGLPQERVLAAIVRLLDLTMVRVGNEEYARTNDSFGLTTLRSRHVQVAGSRVSFQFRGKGAKEHAVQVPDRRLARIVTRLQDLPGQELFQYLADGGQLQTVTSSDVNRYLRDTTGRNFTAKDFRTWAGSSLAVEFLQGVVVASQTEAKRRTAEAIRAAADRLENTPAICKKCYVHPEVLQAFEEGHLGDAWRRARRRRGRVVAALSAAEVALLTLLEVRKRAARAAPPREGSTSLLHALERSHEAGGAVPGRGTPLHQPH